MTESLGNMIIFLVLLEFKVMVVEPLESRVKLTGSLTLGSGILKDRVREHLHSICFHW